MVKRASAPSAASFARSSVVLSCAVEKNFALEAEVSRLRHHVSVLSRRLHRAEKDVSTLSASLRVAEVPTVIPPSSPSPSVASVATVVTVLGGGRDPEFSEDTAEELPRGNFAPTVIPSSPPPFVVTVGVGVPGSDWLSDEAVALPSVVGGVEESVAVPVAVAPSASAEEVPEPHGAEPVAGGTGGLWVATDEAVGDVGSTSAVAPAPGSSSGRRRKSKKRRVKKDLTHPVPLVSESEGSSSRSRKPARSRSPNVVAAAEEGSLQGEPWGTWGCSGCGAEFALPLRIGRAPDFVTTCDVEDNCPGTYRQVDGDPYAR